MQISYRIQSIFVLFLCVLFIFPVVFAKNNDGLKSEVYSRLKCCSCKEPFAQCTCPEAKEMKVYIDALIENKISREDIFYKVAKKYSLDTILDAQVRQNIENRLIREAGEKRPQIILESNSFDFGKRSKKEGKISQIFKFSNQGNSPLLITNIKTSCPCATVSLKVNKKKTPYFGTEGSPKDWQAEIKPEETAELELMVDLASPYVKPGKLIRDASIISNDPVYPDVTVKIEAGVLK